MTAPVRLLCGALFAGATVLSLAQAPANPAPLRDADGRRLSRSVAGHITNYYEDKVPAYTLPDTLVLTDGAAVRDADTWWKRRRPELLKAYETEIFGRVPANAPKVRFEVVESALPVLEGKAIRRHIRAHFGDQAGGPAASFTLYLPAVVTGPVPVVLHLTFGGDPGLPRAPKPNGMPDAIYNDIGPVADLIARGYGYATVRYTDLQPDRRDAAHEGIRGLTLAPGEKPAPDAWGAIAIWSWSLSRFLDYLETDAAVDAKRVALVGHSRLGKTVLWAGAADPRFALIYSSQSGEMGAALSRRDFGESVDDIASGLPQQFAGNFQKYIGRWNEMPHEAHLLIALSAPRPVMITAADGDLWSDPRGQFLAVVAAGPVWRLLGKGDLGTTEMPALDVPVATGSLAYLENKGPHLISPLDWRTFLDFADRHLQPAKP